MELGGPLESDKGPGGAREDNGRKAQGGNLEPWKQDSPGLEGGMTTFLPGQALELPPGQPMP